MDVKFVNESLPGLVQKFGTGLIQNMLKQAEVDPPTGLIKDKLKRKDIVLNFINRDFEPIHMRAGGVFIDNIFPKDVLPISQLRAESVRSLIHVLKNIQTPDQNIIVNIELSKNFRFFIPGRIDQFGIRRDTEAYYDQGLDEHAFYMLNWFPKKNMHGVKYNKVTINFNGDIASGTMRVVPLGGYSQQYIAEAVLENDLYPFIAVREYQTININGKNPQNAKIKYV